MNTSVCAWLRPSLAGDIPGEGFPAAPSAMVPASVLNRESFSHASGVVLA
ncbi:hypothetical protein HLV39_09605 [Marinobacter adhaerens]|uniref:Uncharacterized protein n=1 Tax=Marinobacter adhaerens TaxID=1033846 RepID=A0A851HWV4_9GAMM|nr:hypothetical protein [Marinobacter adhaerens]